MVLGRLSEFNVCQHISYSSPSLISLSLRGMILNDATKQPRRRLEIEQFIEIGLRHFLFDYYTIHFDHLSVGGTSATPLPCVSCI